MHLEVDLRVNNPIEVDFAHGIFDDWVRDHFPRFQKENRQEPGTEVVLNLARCVWASPLPLLLISTELMTHSMPGRIITIDLGCGANTDSAAVSRARVLKYLTLNGLLDTFYSRSDLDVRCQYDSTGESGASGVWFSGSKGFRTVRTVLERINIELLYGEAIVLRAQTWRLPDISDSQLIETIRSKVREILKHADDALFSFKAESRKFRDVTLQRLTQILLELVENAAEHAYFGHRDGYVGIYARVRQFDSSQALESRDREVGKSPLLGQVLLSSKQKQIELFVVDVGRGLFADANSWAYVDHSKIRRQPLRLTAATLFVKPLSRHDRKEGAVSRVRGSSTGLVHLDAILRHQNDSTRIITGNEWLAGSHPRPPGFQDNAVTTGSYLQHSEGIQGTIFHVGLSPSVIPELNAQWFSNDRASSEQIRKSIIQKFGRPRKLPNLTSNVIDIKGGEGLESTQKRVRDVASTRSGTVVRVNRVAEKNLVNRVVVAWIQGCAAASRPASSLYLCELGRYQAIDTLWVVEHLFAQNYRLDLPGAPPKGLSIFLVTEDLCCTTLTVECKPRHDRKFQISLSRATANILRLDNRIVYLLDELRLRDSNAIWKRARELSHSMAANPALLERVQWQTSDGDRVLPYYVNFSVLIQDEEAARTIRRSLRRILALFPMAHGYALDRLVDAPLHDAMKWLILPPKDSRQRVLVGSLSVSGSTLKRYIAPHKTITVGMVDCLQTPYFEASRNSDFPHLAALVWDPELPVHTILPPKYRRIGKSAYVEPITGPVTEPIYDESLYSELETAKLLKMGHWQQGGSHSLLEINTEMALEQSNASESGAIPWLVDRIAELCAVSPVVIAFPLDKLAYRLAHHVRSRLTQRVEGHADIILLPLSYMPRMAGGLTRFVPLVASAAKDIAVSKNGVATAIFLDVGFISMRTMRHSVRQLMDAGFEEIRVLGILNRSSAPELSSERHKAQNGTAEFPQTYWRWNVPVLGATTHCPLCGAMPALGRLSGVVGVAHFDLLTLLRNIDESWTAREITDSWDDFGLNPVQIDENIQDAIAGISARTGIENVLTSTILAARLLEYLRTSGDAEMPLMLLKSIGDLGAYDLMAEALCSILLLANDGLQSTDRHDYVSLLVEAAILGEVDSLATSAHLSRHEKLFGLITIIFAVQPIECKFSILPQVVDFLSRYDIVRAPSIRLAILALTSDLDTSNDVQKKFQYLCTSNSDKFLLCHNYHSVRPTRSNANESWDKMTQAFGRSPGHSQQSELGNLKLEFTRSADIYIAIPRLKRLASLMAQCDPDFVMNTFGIHTRDVIEEAYALETSIRKDVLSALSFNEKVRHVFDDVSKRLHRALVRYGDRAKSPLVYDVFYEMLDDQASLNGLSFLTDIVLSPSANTLSWPQGIGDYFPLGEQVGRLFGEIFSNVRGKSEVREAPPLAELIGANRGLAWMWFDLNAEPLAKGITVVLVTGLSTNRVVTPYSPKVTGIFDFGIDVSSKQILETYFEIRVRIPSLASILEEL